jgi:oligosaccharide repeat unit polymerase
MNRCLLRPKAFNASFGSSPIPTFYRSPLHTMPTFSRIFPIRQQSSLPFYCKPANLFIYTWLMMLASLWFQVSDVSYPHFSLAVFIFIVSAFSFLFGHYLARIVHKLRENRYTPTSYQIDIKKLRNFNFYLACASLPFIVMNLVIYGIPPFFGFFGLTTTNYIEYGKLRQLLFPLLVVLFVNSFLETSKTRKLLYSVFSVLALLCYVARGSIMIMLLQLLIVFSIRTSMSKARIYLISICGAIGAAFLVDFIGTNRTGDQIFFLYMQIKSHYQQWPTVYLWIISYVSTPLSNLCWFVDTARFDHITWSFTYSLLPHFGQPIDPHQDLVETSKIIDGVHTYLSTYFLDFSYFGIIWINILVGLASGYCSSAQRIGRKFLVCSVFLSSIAFMFFTDFFLYLQTFIELGIQSLAHWYFIKELLPQASEVQTQPNKCKAL